MFKLKTKAQSEAVGLLIIVVLLIFMGFIYLKFSLNSNSNSATPYQSARQSIEAHGLLRAFLQLEIRHESSEDKISSCSTNRATCQSLQQWVQDVFYAALQADEDYRLTLMEEGKLLLDAGGCQTGMVSQIPFSVEGVFYEGKLILCNKT